MKLKKIFLPLLAFCMLSAVASTPPAAPKAVISSSIFRGAVIGKDLSGKWIEFYINHQEQRATIPIQTDAQGNYSYSVSIPMDGVPAGSTITFKVDEMVFGFAELDGSAQTLDLRADEQGH